MRAFTCYVCGQLVFFDDATCLSCGTPLGFLPDARELVDLDPTGDGEQLVRWARPVAPKYRRCPNAVLIGCNWMIPADDMNTWCLSCRTTRTRPSDADETGMTAWTTAEAIKRRLLFQLLELGLPIAGENGGDGLMFDLLYAPGHVVTGHQAGVITIDLSEADDGYREQLRHQLDEPYRTLLGHLRHEVAHYYWPILLREPDVLGRFRAHFGDERADYEEALLRHYRDGPPPGWQSHHVSAYASAHPWEGWAETMAHYLHICDTLQTAAAYGIHATLPTDTAPLPDLSRQLKNLHGSQTSVKREGFAGILAEWLSLTYALNELSRSMGQGDLYPFVIAPAVMEKLSFIHELVRR
jgi:hypothetical protein